MYVDALSIDTFDWMGRLSYYFYNGRAHQGLKYAPL
jgi:hypothetical protein